MAQPVEFTFLYLNHRGHRAIRRVQVLDMRWGTTEWYPKPGWLLRALDLDRNVEREFYMLNMSPTDGSGQRADYDRKQLFLMLQEAGSIVQHLAGAGLSEFRSEGMGNANGAMDLLVQRCRHLLRRLAGETTEPFKTVKDETKPETNALEELAKNLKVGQ